MPWANVEPVLDPGVLTLCRRRYHGHPRGCPNWGKRPTCPPRAPLLEDALDLTRPVYAVWNSFDLARHVARMRRRHPGWSRRQLVCCLYWQGTAHKALREELVRFVRERGFGWCIVTCPEARGVDVTDTMLQAGVELEWPPRRWARQVALVGKRAR